MKTLTSINPKDFYPNSLTAQILNDSFDNWFKPSSTIDSILTNITESKDGFGLELVVPGYTKEEIAIAIDNNTLTVSNVKKEIAEDSEKEASKLKYHKKQFEAVNFSKKFKLPKTVDVNNIRAEHKDGILYIVLAKKEEKVIPVKHIEII